VEELDWQQTPMGEISLRRRREPTLDVDVFEVRLGEEFLMSSLFTAAEVALADLGLAQAHGESLDVVVGGLGLGYTAQAVLADPRVRSLAVVEALGEVVGWHERGLLPVSAELTADARCRFVHGDFFSAVAAGGFGGGRPTRCTPSSSTSTTRRGRSCTPATRRSTRPTAARRRRPAAPRRRLRAVVGRAAGAEFVALLGAVFASAEAHVVTFPNHYTGGESANTVYVATTPA
jgi:hypothetical protein